MLDRVLQSALQGPLQRLAKVLVAKGLRPDQVTAAGLVLGLSAVPLIAWDLSHWAIVSILLNRLADGLDGAMARHIGPTDLGAFLDISFDFLFYASIPLAFVLANPAQNGLPGALLIYSFIGTGCTFLAFAVLAAKRAGTGAESGPASSTNSTHPQKGFHYLGGLTESTETIAVFTVMCLVPRWFPELAYGFAALCALTTVTRIAAGVSAFGVPRR